MASKARIEMLREQISGYYGTTTQPRGQLIDTQA